MESIFKGQPKMIESGNLSFKGGSIFQTKKTDKRDLPATGTVSGLLAIAKSKGIGSEAKRVLSGKGEGTTYLSGGFITDIFDVLNTFQYGVTGVLKGKSFMEGVKTRQSFADKDALGEYGLPGTIAGIALDIAVDPLTYIAPWTIVRKIPAAEKAITASAKAFEASKIGQYLGEKLVYMFGKDPKYVELANRMTLGVATGSKNISKIVDGILNLEPQTAQKLLTTNEKGEVIRRNLNEIWDSLNENEKWVVAKAYGILDDLGKQASELGLISQKTWQEHVGEYIRNAYKEHELATGKPGVTFNVAKTKVERDYAKARIDMPEDVRQKLGQIKDPAYLLFKSMFDLNKDIETTKFNNRVAEAFAKTPEEVEALEKVIGKDGKIKPLGYTQLPKTKRFFTTSTGEKEAMYAKIKELNQALKEPMKELKMTFKADKKLMSEIKGLEKELSDLSKLRSEEFYKFFQEGEEVIKTIMPVTKMKTIPEGLMSFAERIKEFQKGISGLSKALKGKKPIATKLPDTGKDIGTIGNEWEILKKTDETLATELERLDIEGVLQRSGFSSKEDFLKAVRGSWEKTPIKQTTEKLKGNLGKLIKVQSTIEKLSQKATNLREIDKRSIDDSFRFLEDTINKMQMEKEKAFETISDLKLGELGGKYLPDNIAESLMEMMKPTDTNIGTKIVYGFKVSKVLLNFPTHVRNVISNMILNDFNGLSLARADVYANAVKEIMTKGKWYREAELQGLGVETLASSEIRDILKQEGKYISGIKGSAIKLIDKLGDLYDQEEQVAKLAQYIFQRTEKGKSAKEAWRIAEAATFNYSQVTPFVRKLRTAVWGVPFITFTVKTTPVIAKTAFTKPTKISNIGKIKNAIEKMSDIKETERERASEPEYIRNGFFVKLPLKDEKGRSAYFDLTYIIPFGDLISGNYFNTSINRETGEEEFIGTSLLRNSVLINTLFELSRNQDFYGDKIWKDSDPLEKKMGDLFRYLVKMYAPPIVSDQLPGGWKSDGTRRKSGIIKAMTSEQLQDQQRTLNQELLKLVGLKIQPIDANIQETYMNWEKTKALQTLLNESGIIKKYQTSYIPKRKTSTNSIFK